MDRLYDYIIIGGGIVGLSTALQLQQRYPEQRILLLEKEAELASQQSGHNSGVIHSGIYYPPGSFKARFCQAGSAAMKTWCRERNIPLREPGKLVVATSAVEVARLQFLFSRSREHRIEAEWLEAAALVEHEPNIRGLAAIRLPGTGIVDYRQVSRQMAVEFQALGGSIQLNAPVVGLNEMRDSVVVRSARGEWHARFLLACAGLQADRLARQLDIAVDFRIIPVRGEYYELPAQRRDLVRHLVYPVPAPDMPFLGVHITPMIDGRITVGPNAVFALRRPGAGSLGQDSFWKDIAESFGFPGFWRMGARHWRYALSEARHSLSRRSYLKAVSKYCPQLGVEDLLPYPPGVRAQAVARDGSLLHDFVFARSARSLHVCNAPSPAATSAFPIGAHLCDKLAASGFC